MLSALLSALLVGSPQTGTIGEVEVSVGLEAVEGGFLVAPVAVGPVGTAYAYELVVTRQGASGRSSTRQAGKGVLGRDPATLVRSRVSAESAEEVTGTLTIDIGGETLVLPLDPER